MLRIRFTPFRSALIIFVVSFAVYSIPPIYDLVHKPFFTWANGQDVASTSILPITLLEHGDFYLDEYRDFYNQNWHSPYFVAEVNGRLVSRSPVSAAVIAIPFYGIPLGTGWLRNPGYEWLTFAWSAFFPAKFASAFFTALAVVMLFFCARELTDLKTSATIALLFGFGTSVWSTASQALWQQTPSILFQSIGIWFLLRGQRKGALAVAPAALFFSAATVSRTNDAIPAILFTFYILIQYRAAFVRWVGWAILPAVLVLVYNTIYNGSPLVFGYQDGVTQDILAPQLEGLAGLLISPSRGLLIYSPFLILSFLSFGLIQKEQAKLFYQFCGLVFILFIVSLSMWRYWDGGWGFGTRMLTDALPYACLLLIPAFQRLGHRARFVVLATGVYAALVQSFGLWDYGVRWHWHWDNWTYNVWDWVENEPLFYLKTYIVMAGHYLNRFLHL